MWVQNTAATNLFKKRVGKLDVTQKLSHFKKVLGVIILPHRQDKHISHHLQV